MKVKKYDELIVWKKSIELVRTIYLTTKCFPREEIYGLTCQMRRAAISVASNIAEGQGRDSTSEFLHHLSYAHGSLIELETQIRIAAMLGFLASATTQALLLKTSETGRILNGLRRSLSSRV